MSVQIDDLSALPGPSERGTRLGPNDPNGLSGLSG